MATVFLGQVFMGAIVVVRLIRGCREEFQGQRLRLQRVAKSGETVAAVGDRGNCHVLI